MLNRFFSIILILSVFVLSCGDQQDYKNYRQPSEESELYKIKQQILTLEGTLSQITSFVASDFSSCNVSLPPFQTMICQISQTATAEQQIVFVGQLQELSKIFQKELYGEDCINTIDPGCPVVGSVTYKIDTLENDISTISSDLSSLQADVATLNAAVANLNARLDNFNGSGSSIETLVGEIQSDISTLDNRLDSLEQVVNNGDIYKTYLICGDIDNSGPAYEPILFTGDNTKASGYIVSGTSNGMGIVSEAGVTGTQYLSTHANTRNCKFKIYDNISSLKMCWKNNDRNASSVQIDSAYDSPSFSNPTTLCTCIN